MEHLRPLILSLGIIIGLAACSRMQTNNVNLEQAHNPLSAHMIAPGMGTIGLIAEDAINIYFPQDVRTWLQDEASRFDLPQPNSGIIAAGIGTIGVANKGVLHFYRLDATNQWSRLDWADFALPRRYDRIIVMKMPWEMGVLGLESNGLVDFYFFYDGEWQVDPSASFTIPKGIDSYYPLGDMTLAVVQNNKLGIYYLGPEDGWEFLDHEPFILLLPDNFKGIIPYEPGKIAVLLDNKLGFYQLDLYDDRWIRLADLEFHLPY